ncbi:MAG: carbohydrate-binding family V/XII [Holophagae bacterium]|jgi:hypothetical protein
MRQSRVTSWVAIAMALSLWTGAEAAIEWPQEIESEEATIVVYQPQPEELDGNLLEGRAAVAIELKSTDEPVFGAMWFTARIDTDREAGTALVRDVTVTDVRWPDSKDPGEQRFTQIVEAAVPANGFEISLDALSASLATAERERESLEDLRHEPPEIVFSSQLAVLLLYDGEPRFSPVEGSPYERVLNTPFLVVRNTRSTTCYLSSGALWYRADDPMGPWSTTASPPKDLVEMLPPPDSDDPPPDVPPEIVVATVPTELVVTDGEPRWESLTGGEILYVKNTETAWLRDLATGNMYVLLSGRWFRAESTDGPWTFVPADQLPASFSDIPPASDIGGVRTSVAGTDEAEEAILDAYIPQTAAIKRSEATLEVSYDGAPKFERIPGTEVSSAVNTGAQVLLVGGRYYAVDNGVWFTSASDSGPWVVADEIPSAEISEIPPSSPVYNTTYVEVYESTPEVVYVGYRPGYLWSYPCYGVPVYGTGWYYPPYWGRWYYPRPPTWGLHVGYNPWTGWNFGMSWSNGFFSFGMSWGGGWGGSHYRPWGCCGSGWYGGGYRRPVIINTGDINIGNTINVGNRVAVSNRIGNNVNLDRSRRTNIYNRPENKGRVADRATVQRDVKRARASRDRDNNVYADRSGAVARRDGDGWQVRDQGRWTPESRPSTRPSTPSTRPSTPSTRPGTPSTRPSTRPSTPSTRPSTPSTRPSTHPSTRPSTRPSTPQINRNDLNRAHRARQAGHSRPTARPMPQGGGMRRR